MQAIGPPCPKFKLLGTTMTLRTRVCKVLCTQNIGFKKNIATVLKELNDNQLEYKQYYFDKLLSELTEIKSKILQSTVK